MAREIVVKTWCDPCLVQDRHVEAEEVTVDAAELSRGPLMVALCDRHRKEVYDPLHDLLREHGQSPQTALPAREQAKGEPIRCPRCDFASASRGSLSTHARRMHEVSLEELLGEDAPYVCGICDRRFGKPQGVGVHRRLAHPGAG